MYRKLLFILILLQGLLFSSDIEQSDLLFKQKESRKQICAKRSVGKLLFYSNRAVSDWIFVFAGEADDGL